jgi:nucleotidyltransferase substrate binding protein (TIGR01987 family)
MEDVRWKQRFENFEKAYRLFREIFVDGNPQELSDLEQTGGVQRFEFTFELAWKTLKDYLIHQGVGTDELTARPTIKEGFAARILTDGKTWIDMLETRNKLAHTYDEQTFRHEIKRIVTHYPPAFEQLYTYLKARLES